MNGGRVVPPHQDGISCVTRPRVRLRDENRCRYNHTQQLEHINRQIVPVPNRCTQSCAHIVVKLKTLPHAEPGRGAPKMPPHGIARGMRPQGKRGRLRVTTVHRGLEANQRRPQPSCHRQTPNQHVGVELRTQVDLQRRRRTRVRCVVGGNPRANGRQAYLVMHASHKAFF